MNEYGETVSLIGGNEVYKGAGCFNRKCDS